MIKDLDIQVIKHPLTFRNPAQTSRDVLLEKPTWFVVAQNAQGCVGIGECSLIPGLSPEHPLRAQRALNELASGNTLDPNKMTAQYPAVKFAAEMALVDLLGGGDRTLFPSPFTAGEALPINGLVWMDDFSAMLAQVESLLDQGFKTIKVKVGQHDFKGECEFLEAVRKLAPSSQFSLRLDANGAFDGDSFGAISKKLDRLSDFSPHSLEQPIRPGQWDRLAQICSSSPIPIALDEELIGVNDSKIRQGLLAWIKPAYIVLKPSLLGGFAESGDWIDCAREANVGWWITSALESNIGLNAIAQWTADALIDTPPEDRLPQGLGTGGLFTNNIPSPLCIADGTLRLLDNPQAWDTNTILK
ncbi:MAG: o-succinylbenzoate synthase [Flavobacteriales bacterium]|nr:o-succinylbenzoate synthase [Flavobacteriales bacterium]